MQDLSTLRTRWTEIEAEETRLLREMTVAEGLRQFALLYETYVPRWNEDADYQAEREAALLERQRRLPRLAEWLKEHPEDSPRS